MMKPRAAGDAMATNPDGTRQADYLSPHGIVRFFARDGRLCRVVLGAAGGPGSRGRRERADPALVPFVRLLARYFRGGEILCDESRLCLDGLTDFQRLVLRQLVQVRAGEVVTYGELAGLAGHAGAGRAVGRALGANPLPIFIPCHRVVAAGRRPGGFGAGLRWKRALLRHEGWVVRAGRIARSADSPFAQDGGRT